MSLELYNIVNQYNLAMLNLKNINNKYNTVKFGGFITKILHLAEISGTSDIAINNSADANVSFTPVYCKGLTKANGILHIELKCDKPNRMRPFWNQIEITSSGGCDVNEWSISQPDGITTEYKQFVLPLASANTVGGELNVEAINYIRWYCFADDEDITISWKNAYIEYQVTDINNKYNTVKLILLDIINKFNSVIEVLSDDINSKFYFSKTRLFNINNELRNKKLVLSNIQINFRMKLQSQVPLIGSLQPLGKAYFTVKINNVDITDSLNVDIDTLHWREVLNASTEADFVLALPYDSDSKPTLGEAIEILFNDNRKFYGYITTITKSVEPEGISVHAEGEYNELNEDAINFYIGRKSDSSIAETYYLTYKQALSSLGLDLDIGDFVPLAESYINVNKADAISQIIQKCGNFSWFINPNGTSKLWQGNKGSIINLERQSIGQNLSLYQVIKHNISENDSDKIDRIKVIMGDDVRAGYDNVWRGVGLNTAFRLKSDSDANIYEKLYISNAGWEDLRDETYQAGEVSLDGWRIVIPAGYIAGSDITKKLIPKGFGWVNYHENENANENIDQIYQVVEWWAKGGIYPEGRKSHIFYIGSGDITKILELSNLNRQYGVNYKNYSVFATSWGSQETIPHNQSRFFGKAILYPPSIIIPSWDDTLYATDIANLELEKYKDIKITGTLNITFDCAEFYELDLSKRIKCDGILDTPVNIVAIDYNVGSYMVSITVESMNYYKRSVSIPVHSQIGTI